MLIFNKRNERIDRYNAQAAGQPQPEQKRVVSDMEIFKLMGIAGGVS